MTRAILIILTTLLCGCSSVTKPESAIGTYFRKSIVHDEPTGELVLTQDGRYTFFSTLPQSVDAKTGAPFYGEDSGTWLIERGTVVLQSDSGDSERLKIVSGKHPLSLEWDGHLYLKKER